MSLPKINRLPSARLLSSFLLHQQLPSISPLAVPRRGVIQGDYRRPGKPKEDKFPWQKINFNLSKGLEGIKKNFALLKKEFTDRWVGPEGKPIIEHMLEQNRVIWEFKGPESLEQWTVSSDREIGGQSDVCLKLGKYKNTCFLYGTLNSTPPRDGETRYSGYCTMRSQQPRVSDWSHTFTSAGLVAVNLSTAAQVMSLLFTLVQVLATWEMFLKAKLIYYIVNFYPHK